MNEHIATGDNGWQYLKKRNYEQHSFSRDWFEQYLAGLGKRIQHGLDIGLCDADAYVLAREPLRPTSTTLSLPQ